MPIRLGILGTWHVHADGLIKQIAAYPDEFELVAAFDPEPAVVQQRRQGWDALLPSLRWHASPEAVLSEQLDGVVIEGRVSENIGWARRAVDRGYAVLLEKPAGDTLKPYQQLMAVAQQKRLHVQLIYLFRYMSAMKELRDRVARGELGQIYEFRGRLPKDISLYEEYVRDLGQYRGGIFFEMAGHLVDLLVSVMGEPKSVTPFLAHHHVDQQPGCCGAAGLLPQAFIDNGVAIFEQQHGWGIIEVPALEVAPQSRRIEVYGTEGACVIPHLGSGHLGNRQVQPIEIFSKSQPDWERIELPAATLQISDLREFAAVITGKKAPDFSPEHDLIVHQALLKASGHIESFNP